MRTPAFDLAHCGDVVAHVGGHGLAAWQVLNPQHARDLLSDLTAEALAYDRADDPRGPTTARNALDLARAIRAQDARRWRAERTMA